MTRAEAQQQITTALEAVLSGEKVEISEETHLTEDGILDSLDIMLFLFELESGLGHKFKSIDEDFTDFRVSTLIDICLEETSS